MILIIDLMSSNPEIVGKSEQKAKTIIEPKEPTTKVEIVSDEVNPWDTCDHRDPKQRVRDAVNSKGTVT